MCIVVSPSELKAALTRNAAILHRSYMHSFDHANRQAKFWESRSELPGSANRAAAYRRDAAKWLRKLGILED